MTSVLPNILIAVPGEKEKLPLSVTHPELAKEADGWDPNTVTAGSHKKLKWICREGHFFEAIVKNRSAGSGCRTCYVTAPRVMGLPLTTTHPNIAAEADGWDPANMGAGSTKKLGWKCRDGHTWNAVVNSRTSGNRGCPYCSNNKVWPGFNDIATTHPEIAKSLYKGDPTKLSSGSEKVVEWKCERGHLFKLEVKKRISRGYGCPYCSNSRVLQGFNDLVTSRPDIASEADGWDPKSVIAGSAVYKWWLCANGHRYRTTVSSRVASNSGCPTCHIGGFDPNQDGYLYFISHPDWKMLQIGITNYPDSRLKGHRKLGWKLLEMRGPMDGHLTQQWETAILRMLKSKGADLSNKEIAGKFDGYSEAWSKSSFEVKSIKEMMQATEDYESGL
jgi:hypothetical protein